MRGSDSPSFIDCKASGGISLWPGKTKRGASVASGRPAWKRFRGPVSGPAFPVWPSRIRSVNQSPLGAASASSFAQRSNRTRARSKLATVVLRANAGEVKKKFRGDGIEIDDQAEKYFSRKLFFAFAREIRAFPCPKHMRERRFLWRRRLAGRFAARSTSTSTPAGRRRYEPRQRLSQDRISMWSLKLPMNSGRVPGHGLSLR